MRRGFLVTISLISAAALVLFTIKLPKPHATKGAASRILTNRPQDAEATRNGSPPLKEDEQNYAEWFLEETRRNPWFEGAHPFSFWGRVVDDETNGIPGAVVQCEWSDLSPEGTSKASLTSDSNGHFELLNRKGKFLTVIVSKEGYHKLPGESVRGFELVAPFDRIHPDPKNPIVFKLRKAFAAEPLVVCKGFSEFPTNSIRGLDLTTGEWTNPDRADIVIRFVRDQQRTGARWNWQVTLTAVEGGIQECGTSDFQAPETGYLPELNYKFEVDSAEYTTDLSKVFFVNTRGLKFVRLESLLMGIWRDESAVRFKSWLNPTGSRNLEFDKSLQPLPPGWY